MKIPRISVVLPVFNAVTTIARAVKSIRTQTMADWELLVVDDGSTDGTRERLQELARVDARLRVLARAHEGVARAANAGLAAARGELIARMDADDVAHPERFADQAAVLVRDLSVGVVSCDVEFGGDRSANAGYALHVAWLNSLKTPEEIALNRFIESPVANPGVMFRRELVARHGAFRDGDFPEDYELWLRWLDAGVRIAKVPRVLLTWHDSPLRLTRTDARYSPDAFFRMKSEWIAKHIVGRGLLTPPSGTGTNTGTDPHADAERRRREPPPYNGQKKLFVWGAGRHTRKRAAHLETHGVRIDGYIDVDAKKTGRGIGGVGLPVIAPEELPAPGKIFVLSYVTTRGARDYNRAQLVQRGYVEGADFLMCG